MNTQTVKKTAIAKQLGELLEGTCRYSPETQARFDAMEPDTYALREFMGMLASMASAHFENNLDKEAVQYVIDFCYQVGYRVGHILSQGLTGTWGVRISQLENIKKILDIPDFEMVTTGDLILVLNKYDGEIKQIEINSSCVWVTVKITNEYEYEEEFPMDFSWKNIDKLRKG